jgi:hypothetical protein
MTKVEKTFYNPVIFVVQTIYLSKTGRMGVRQNSAFQFPSGGMNINKTSVYLPSQAF